MGSAKCTICSIISLSLNLGSKVKSLVICGISASGKTTLASEISGSKFSRVITSTTRGMRAGEKDGVDYHFLSKEEFLQGIKNDEFVDYSEIHGNYYGSRISDYKTIHQQGKTAVLVCDPIGPKNLAEYAKRNPDFTFSTIFLHLTPSDAAKRFLQRLDQDLEGVEPSDVLSVVERNAKRMSKIFHPDQKYCIELCNQHLMGRGKVEGKLARLYQEQQKIALQLGKSPCPEHQWASEYPYDLVIKEGIDEERQPGVIRRIEKLLGINQDMDKTEIIKEISPL